MEDEIVEIVEFLSNPRADVRQAAVDIVVGLTTEDPGIQKLIKAHVVKPLCRLLGDLQPIAEASIKALINITATQPIASEQALNYDVIHRVMNQLEEPEWRLKNLSLMLLANISTLKPGARALVNDPKCGELLLIKLTTWFMQCEPEPEGAETITMEPKWDDPFQYVANILANVTQTEQGRAFMLQKQNEQSLLQVLVPQLRSPNVVRRRGVLNTIRNLAFETESHPILCQDLLIVPHLLFMICGPEELSEEDKEGMHAMIYALGTQKSREHDALVRLSIVDIFVLLCTTRNGREFLRIQKVYPIVRDAHLVEDDDAVGEQIYKLVGFLMRDEEGEEPDWDEIRKQSVEPRTEQPVMPKRKLVQAVEPEEEVEEDIPEDVACALELEAATIESSDEEEDDLAELD